MNDSDLTSASGSREGDVFATTQWSLVLTASDRTNGAADHALEQLCQAYWQPLYAYVRRRVGQVEEADDLTQAFFERLLEKKYLSQADPQRGRFRAFLLAALKHFLCHEWERARAQKRGGKVRRIPLDFAMQDSLPVSQTDERTAEKHFDREWAMSLLDRIMDRLQREVERKGNGRQFQILKDFIGRTGKSGYGDVARELGVSESAARMAASRLRARYRELLRDEISQTVCAEADIDDEIRLLFAAFSG